jgi:hypothetical protein
VVTSDGEQRQWCQEAGWKQRVRASMRRRRNGGLLLGARTGRIRPAHPHGDQLPSGRALARDHRQQ